jgi:hypothetical protein
MRVLGANLTAPDVQQTRVAIRDALVALDRPENAAAGLLGPIYFDAERATPRTAAFGVATGHRYSSAFKQLRPYAPSANLGLEEDLASGVALEWTASFWSGSGSFSSVSTSMKWGSSIPPTPVSSLISFSGSTSLATIRRPTSY